MDAILCTDRQEVDLKDPGAEGLRRQPLQKALLGDQAEGIAGAEMGKHSLFLERQIQVVGGEGLWCNMKRLERLDDQITHD